MPGVQLRSLEESAGTNPRDDTHLTGIGRGPLTLFPHRSPQPTARLMHSDGTEEWTTPETLLLSLRRHCH